MIALVPGGVIVYTHGRRINRADQMIGPDVHVIPEGVWMRGNRPHPISRRKASVEHSRTDTGKVSGTLQLCHPPVKLPSAANVFLLLLHVGFR